MKEKSSLISLWKLHKAKLSHRVKQPILLKLKIIFNQLPSLQLSYPSLICIIIDVLSIRCSNRMFCCMKIKSRHCFWPPFSYKLEKENMFFFKTWWPTWSEESLESFIHIFRSAINVLDVFKERCWLGFFVCFFFLHFYKSWGWALWQWQNKAKFWGVLKIRDFQKATTLGVLTCLVWLEENIWVQFECMQELLGHRDILSNPWHCVNLSRSKFILVFISPCHSFSGRVFELNVFYVIFCEEWGSVFINSSALTSFSPQLFIFWVNECHLNWQETKASYLCGFIRGWIVCIDTVYCKFTLICANSWKNIHLKCSRFCNMVCISLFYSSIQIRQLHDCWSGWTALVRQRRLYPAFFSVDVFVLADAIKNVQPVSQCVLTSVSFFIENRATLGLGSRDPGSLWCYCWITEGIGQQISRGLSAGVRLALLCAAERPGRTEAALPELLYAKVQKKRKKNWGGSIACCVMQNNVICSVYWNQEGWSFWIQKSFQTGATLWKQQKASTGLAGQRRRFVWCASSHKPLCLLVLDDMCGLDAAMATAYLESGQFLLGQVTRVEVTNAQLCKHIVSD